MGRVIIDMSPSLDGYIAGRGVTIERPFGDADHRLHRWLGFDSTALTDADQEAAAQMFATTGAFLIGRRMFDVGIDKWGEDGAFGKPCFVVTNRPREDLAKGPTTFTFVSEGLSHAIALARAAARDQDVVVAGGANLAQQCIAAGYVDELRLHVVPVLLGGGTLLFNESVSRGELEATSVVASPNATHLTFKVMQTKW